MAATYLLNTKAEFLKSKRTAAIWITIIGAAFIPALNFARLVFDPYRLVPAAKDNPWGFIFNDNWKMCTAVMIPIFVILITSLLVQIEYKNNTWKQVYSSPRSNADIFFSKFLVINAMILLCLLLFNVFIILFSYAANLVEKQYGFFASPVPWKTFWSLLWKIYYGVMAMIAIQYWLSLRFRNFIVPICLGIAFLIIGFVVDGWERLYLYPYMYHAIFYYPEFHKIPGTLFKAEMFDGLWVLLILLLSYRDSVQRKERG